MSRTGRWTDREKDFGFRQPIAQIEAMINSQQIKLQTMSVPNTSGAWAHVATRNALDNMNSATTNIGKLSAVKTRVIGLLHQFVSDVYYEKTFDKLSESLFESFV
jgi:hypothetical protein